MYIYPCVGIRQLEVDQIYHLACPASPPHYQYNPIKTIKTSTEGTLNMLGLAKRTRARMLLTSTSEVSDACFSSLVVVLDHSGGSVGGDFLGIV